MSSPRLFSLWVKLANISSVSLRQLFTFTYPGILLQQGKQGASDRMGRFCPWYSKSDIWYTAVCVFTNKNATPKGGNWHDCWRVLAAARYSWSSSRISRSVNGSPATK